MNLGNCPRCDKLYAMGLRDICQACIKETDQEYDKCAKYLRENRGATMHELSEATEVSLRQITKFVREGRISVIDAPNLHYPCEVCGSNMIREGNMCDSCRSRLTKELNQAVREEQFKKDTADMRRKDTYSVVDKFNKH